MFVYHAVTSCHHPLYGYSIPFKLTVEGYPKTGLIFCLVDHDLTQCFMLFIQYRTTVRSYSYITICSNALFKAKLTTCGDRWTKFLHAYHTQICFIAFPLYSSSSSRDKYLYKNKYVPYFISKIVRAATCRLIIIGLLELSSFNNV